MFRFISVLLIVLGSIGCAARSRAPGEDQGSPGDTEALVGGSRLSLALHALRLPNLAYQLDCMADRMPCSTAAYVDLWRNVLGWDEQDDQALLSWKAIRSRYEGTVKRRTHQVPLQFPQFTRGMAVEDLQRVISFTARTRDEHRRMFALLLSAPDAVEMDRVLARFEPRFDRWWNQVGSTAGRTFVGNTMRLVHEHKVLDVLERTAGFFESQLQVDTGIDVHVMVRPPLATDTSTRGQQLGQHTVVETLVGEPPAARLEVVAHEVVHLLHASMSVDARQRLEQQFVASGDPHAMVWWALYDEVLASTIGNGVVGGRLSDPAKFAARLAREDGLYADPEIGSVARTLLPGMKQLLEDNVVAVSPIAFATYAHAATTALGSKVKPASFLRVCGLLSQESLKPLARSLRTSIPMGASWMYSPVDQDALNFVNQYKHLSLAVFVTPADLGRTELWDGVVADEERASLAALIHQPGPMVYAARRSPKSVAFIFVGGDATSAQELVERFAELTEMKMGLLITPGGSDQKPMAR